MKKERTNRQSNIELLRILSILFIISFHYVYKSGFISETLNYNTFIVKSFYFLGELGVNLFMLITGYFMINGKFRLKKLILILGEVLFYYLIMTFIGIKIGELAMPNNFSSVFLLFFPTILSKYWFVTVYIIIYILSPYLNILAKNMSQIDYKRFLITCLVMWCIIPTFFGVFFNSSESILYYSRLIWLIIIYFVGAFIKLHGFNILKSNKKQIICAISSYLAMLLSILVIYKFRFKLGNLGLYELAYFWTPNNMLMFLLSISLFGIFLNIKMKSNKIINIVASTTLGIYLLHDSVICYYFWVNIFKSNKYLSGRYPLEHILLSTLMIFIAGVLIDLFRQLIEKYSLNRIIDFIIRKPKEKETI